MSKTSGNRPGKPLVQSAMPAWANGRRKPLPRRSRIHWSTWAFLAVLGGLAIYAALPDPPFSLDGPPLAGAVERVADGDTIEIAGQRIRLPGMDAPEWNQTCKTADGGTWDCGRAAAQRMSELTRGKTLACRAEGHDRYGRLLAVCRAGNTDIAETLVADGLAISTSRYASAEAVARKARRGLWQGDFATPAEWRAGEASGEGVTPGNPSRFERFIAWLVGLFSS
jgi:endonuclease YncB( thermonuclease family)